MQILFLLVIFAGAIGEGNEDKGTNDESTPNIYKNCRISVIGSGWGGAYFTWKITRSLQARYNVNEICIFEQSKTRIGGRAYTFGHSSWEDLTVELGAYRYSTSLQLTKGVVENILNLTTVCYNGPCDDTTGYRIISDPYSNNGGYSKAIKGLIGKFIQAGGKPVFMGHKLKNIKKNSGQKHHSYPIRLYFENGMEVITEKVLLNLPSSAIQQLESDNILFTQGNPYVEPALRSPIDITEAKQFVWYPDAWWLTKLNLTLGEISEWGSRPPISQLRYADGAVKCYTILPNGTRQYSPTRVPGGTCYGALMATYVEFDDDSFYWLLDNWVTPAERAIGQTAVFIQRGDSREYVLDQIHAELMSIHNDSLWAVGVDPATITPPTSTVLSFWNSGYNPTYPAFYNYYMDTMSNQFTTDGQYSLRNIVIKPLKNVDIYIANEAYAMGGGWAEGSLTLVERILGSFFGFKKPNYVTDLYWNQLVIPYLTLPQVHQCKNNDDCKSPNNCVVGKCKRNSCEWNTKTGSSCFQDDLCNLNTTCSYTGMCYGPELTCPNSSDICVGGDCQPLVTPSLPECTYTNSIGPLNLYWEFIGTDSIRFAYQIPGFGYSAFGIGSSMINADIVIGAFLSDGSIQVKDYWSFQPGPPFLDSDIGGTNDLKDIYIATGGWGAPQIVWFTRKLNTGDAYDQVIVNGTMNFIYAWSGGFPGSIEYHQNNRNHITVDLSQCNNIRSK